MANCRVEARRANVCTQYIYFIQRTLVRAGGRAALTATLFSQSALLSSSNFLMVENSAVMSESEKLMRGKEGKKENKTH